VRPPACDQRRNVTPFSPASREALGPRYRSGGTSDWLKFKNPAAVQRKAKEDWDSAVHLGPLDDRACFSDDANFTAQPARRR
jgi:hypothetical protein